MCGARWWSGSGEADSPDRTLQLRRIAADMPAGPDNDFVFGYFIDKPVGVPFERRPSNLFPDLGISEGMSCDGLSGSLNSLDEIEAELRIPLLIPLGGFHDLDLSLREEDDLSRHENRRYRRSRTSSQGMAEPGFWAYWVRRCSISAHSSSVKGVSSDSTPTRAQRSSTSSAERRRISATTDFCSGSGRASKSARTCWAAWDMEEGSLIASTHVKLLVKAMCPRDSG